MPQSPSDTGQGIRVLEGDTFFLSDDCGNVRAAGMLGLFHKDTRFLSRYWVEVNGRLPLVLTAREVNHYSAAFFLTNPHGEAVPGNTLSIIRHRLIGDGVHEELLVHNHNREPVRLRIALHVDCDFADLFEVRSQLVEKKGRLTYSVDEGGGALRYTYRRESFFRRTVIAFSPGARLERGAAVFEVTVPPKGSWRAGVDITLETDAGRRAPRRGPGAFPLGQAAVVRSLQEWHWSVPALRSDSDALDRAYRQSCTDLASLRLRAGEGEEHQLPAAGLPWFMTIFGRDTLITSYQTLLFGPDLATGALRALAARQGRRVDDYRDEEPGKILHEVRFGELAAFGETPHSPYFGSADATPLFLILLHEVYRWTADRALVTLLRPNALAALRWIDKHGDRDADGYVEYRTRSPAGLRNQGWKDSWDGVLYADGTPAEPPLALCEVQGYVYDAKVRTAELADEVWGDGRLAARLRREAAALKERFNRDFWVERRGGYFAVALDGAGRQVDSLTSNIGHLLWSGIVEPGRAAAVVRQLMSEGMYSGWGVRTLSAEEQGFNPISYHGGTVWPHDNSLIAAGLARYGYRAEAGRIAADLLEAAAGFGHRLPEVFAGYSRQLYPFPVRYPTSASPQAWASGTPPLLLRTVLGLEPDRRRRRLTLRPCLPDSVGAVELCGLRAFGKRYDVSVRGKWHRVRETDAAPG